MNLVVVCLPMPMPLRLDIFLLSPEVAISDLLVELKYSQEDVPFASFRQEST